MWHEPQSRRKLNLCPIAPGRGEAPSGGRADGVTKAITCRRLLWAQKRFTSLFRRRRPCRPVRRLISVVQHSRLVNKVGELSGRGGSEWTDADDGVSGVAAAADERDVVVFRGRINGINLSGSFGFGAALPHTPFPSSSTPSFSGRQFPAVQLPLTAPLPRPAPPPRSGRNIRCAPTSRRSRDGMRTMIFQPFHSPLSPSFQPLECRCIGRRTG